MSRKDYIAAVKIVHQTKEADKQAVVDAFMSLFRDDNPRFDSARFLEACNKTP